ncbi:unnamed protein product, partial [Scytosiphon promiscuus]
KGAWGRGKIFDLAPLARELPEFLAQAVELSGNLRSLASCQAVSRAWRDALCGRRGKDLFGSIVRSSGVSAALRPAVWQALVLRAVGGGVGGSGGGSGEKNRRASSSGSATAGSG